MLISGDVSKYGNRMLSTILSSGSSRFDILLGALCGDWFCWPMLIAPCCVLSRKGILQLTWSMLVGVGSRVIASCKIKIANYKTFQILFALANIPLIVLSLKVLMFISAM